MDYRDSVNQTQETTGYLTEKNFEMLKLIVNASSNPRDLVLDCFGRSEITLGAAFELNRQWIGVDCIIESLKAIIKRFTSGLEAYGNYVTENNYSKCTLDILPKCPFEICGNEETKGTNANHL